MANHPKCPQCREPNGQTWREALGNFSRFGPRKVCQPCIEGDEVRQALRDAEFDRRYPGRRDKWRKVERALRRVSVSANEAADRFRQFQKMAMIAGRSIGRKSIERRGSKA